MTPQTNKTKSKHKYFLSDDLCEGLSYLFIIVGLIITFAKWEYGLPIWGFGMFLNLCGEWIDQKERRRVGLIQDD